MAVRAKENAAAKRYYTVIVDKADRKSEQHKEAKAWLKKNK